MREKREDRFLSSSMDIPLRTIPSFADRFAWLRKLRAHLQTEEYTHPGSPLRRRRWVSRHTPFPSSQRLSELGYDAVVPDAHDESWVAMSCAQ